MSSVRMYGAGPPAAAISFATSCSSAPRRAVMHTFTPSDASPLAMARPMPRLAPVTRAVLSFNLRSIESILQPRSFDCSPPLLSVSDAGSLDHFAHFLAVRPDQTGQFLRRAGNDVRAGFEEFLLHLRLVQRQ